MDSTNETHSSEHESTSNEMSYLYGRDPSILAYGQRPIPPLELKKNLTYSMVLEEENIESIDNSNKISSISSDSSSNKIQTIKVFLRMKPFPLKIKNSDQLNAYTILNSTTLLTRLPSIENNFSYLKKTKENDVITRKFTFSKIFGAETTQLQLFESSVKDQMVDFLAGKNSVVMTYGTTNSGKTYTLQGTPESPGLIPRSIDYVFSKINPQTSPIYKPTNFGDIVYLDTFERRHEIESKMKLLSFNTLERSCHLKNFNQMQKLLHAESPIKANPNYDTLYCVWISFAEIYNETIYDLLSNNCQKKRPPLKLAVDNKGRAFIKGLKSICVSSGEEAYQALMVGQYNLKVAATALNSRSSRSHCIFTIKLLQYKVGDDPLSVKVSSFAFCDLAGSERLKKTLNVGERLKEAQNINTSLLVLGRCLRTIYDTQNCPKLKTEIGPFRESKLTRLFQKALLGKEQISLIVNLNPGPDLYVETQNVLNFSAIAKKIIIDTHESPKRKRSHSRFSRLVTQNLKTDVDWEDLGEMTEESEACSEFDPDENYIDQMHYEEIITENEVLKKEIETLKKSTLARDMQTRKEMTDMYTKILEKIELDWKDRMSDMEEQQEDLRELAIERMESFYKNKLKELKNHPLTENDLDDSNTSTLAEMESENLRLKARVETYKKSIRDLKNKNKEAEIEMTKISSKLAIALEDNKHKNELLQAHERSMNLGSDGYSNKYIEELNLMIEEKNERITKMKTFLNEAKEEYINITDQAQKMETMLKEQEELLGEKTELIRDLEEQLYQSNENSAYQTKRIEALEEELELLSKKCDSNKEIISGTELLQTDDDKIKDHSEISQPVIESIDQCNELIKEPHPEEIKQQKEVEDTIETLQTKIRDLNLQIQENNEKMVSAQKDLEHQLKDKSDEHARFLSQEHDKDQEITKLQKEIKSLIQEKENDAKKMEIEVKNVLRKLTFEKEQVIIAEEKYKKLDKECKKVAQIFEMKINKFEEKLTEQQTENAQLKQKIIEMNQNLSSTDNNLEAYIKSKDETILSYENLIKFQQIELEQLRKEVRELKRILQDTTNRIEFSTPHPKNAKNSRHFLSEKKSKKKGLASEDGVQPQNLYSEKENEEINIKKEFSPNSASGTCNVESLTSDSVKGTEDSSKNLVKSTKKSKKKKLFSELEESFVDLSAEPSPGCRLRSLRKK